MAFVEDDQFPFPYHPATYDDEGTQTVDLSVTVMGFQLRPLTWTLMAAWCGGTQEWTDSGQAIVLPGGAGTVTLGNYVMETQPGVFMIEPADGFYQRYQPEDPDEQD